MPQAFSLRSRTNVPWIFIVVLTLPALLFNLFNGLETIAAFSSITFLLDSIGVSPASLKLRKKTKSAFSLVGLGILLMSATVSTLIVYLRQTQINTLFGIAGIYVFVMLIELLFSKREII